MTLRVALVLTLTLGLSGCGDREPASAEPTDAGATDTGSTDLDPDSDGFTGEDDCDEEDPEIHVGAVELCDEIDNDCDGATDEDAEDAPTWYPDVDDDGYGWVIGATTSCQPPSGHVVNADDCDDTDPAVNPAATELCNEVDDDCDGTTDGPESSDAATWYPDDDGDGYGDGEEGTETTSCEGPHGGVTDGTDCDDSNPSVHPGATESDCLDPTDYNCDGSTSFADVDRDGHAACLDCDDGDATRHPGAVETCDLLDQDCDGDVDEDALDMTDWYPDEDGDGHGTEGSTVLSCFEPSGHAGVADDCDDDDAAIYPGADELCNGISDDCDGEVDEDAVDMITVYLDYDYDGYGDTSSATFECDDEWLASFWARMPGDCENLDATVYPGAPELCDGVDNDCDDEEDEEEDVLLPTWYADGDGDGFGSADAPIEACPAPSGHVTDATDCDNGDPDAHPGAVEVWYDGVDGDCDAASDFDGDGDGFDSSDHGGGGGDCDDADGDVHPDGLELCNGVDDDCNGSTDGPDAADASTWYPDDDVDGFGGADGALVACDAPPGYLSDSSDCDDSDDASYPFAAESDCSDPVDHNCDGSAGDADADGDGSVACEDCDDGDASLSPSAEERCDGIDNDCDGRADDVEVRDLGSDLGPAVATGTTVGAGDDHGDSCLGNTAEDVVLSWTAPAAGTYTLITDGSAFDTVLTTWSEACSGEQTCDDDGGSGVLSRQAITVEAGEQVIIVVDGYGSAAGDYELGIFASAELDCGDGADEDGDGNTDCADSDCSPQLGTANGLAVATGSTEGTADDLLPSCAEPGAEDETWRWVAPAVGDYTFDTEGSDFDTVLVLTSGDCSGVELACDDDGLGSAGASSVTLSLEAGEAVMVTVDGAGAARGTYQLNICDADADPACEGVEEDPASYTAIPAEDLVLVNSDGDVYLWPAGADAPELLHSVSGVVEARRGEKYLNLLDGDGTVINVDLITGEEVAAYTGMSEATVDCGGLNWTVGSSSFGGVDESGTVMTVDVADVSVHAAAAEGVLYAGYESPYRAWISGFDAVDCATGEVLFSATVGKVDKMFVDHGALVILGEYWGSGSDGQVAAWDTETGEGLFTHGVGPTIAWGGRADGVQFAQYYVSYVQTMGWWTGTGAITLLPALSIHEVHDNFVVLFDGDDPDQLWLVDGDTQGLAVYQVVPDGSTYRMEEVDAPSLGSLMFIDTLRR